MKLEDRTVLITGASRGIGRAWAEQLAASGATVIATCRKPEDAAALENEGIQVEALDVTSDSSVQALADKLGDRAIDLLINNAGIFGPEPQPWDDTDLEEFDTIYRTNVLGVVRVTRALKPNLLQSDEPWVVNVSSGVGSIARNQWGTILGYRMSKAALNMFTKNLMLDEKALRVVSVHPGWVKTDMGGAEADLEIDESVSSLTTLFRQLCDEDNGRFFNVDGSELPW